MSDLAHAKTDQKLEEMEKRLSAIYSRAEKEIQQTADEYFSKFAKQDEAKRKLLEQGKITEEEYKKWRKGKVMYGKRFAEMKEQCAKKLLNVNKTAIAYINGELPEVYALNYNAIESAVDGVGGYSFTLVDADTVRNLAVTDTSLLPYKEIDPAKDIPWNMKKINAETLQGILQGESMDKIAKRMMNVQEMNKTQAIRSARTIVTGAECKGRQDSYKRAQDDGIILRKYWIATYDKRARDWHKDAGNDYTEEKAIEIDDFFIVDGEKMLHPGDAMHGASGHNLYNCRCSIASKVVGFKKAQVQKAIANSFEQKYGFELPENTPKEVRDDLSKGLDWSVANIPGFKTGKNGAITGVKYHSDSYERALAFIRTSESVLSLNKERIADYISHDLIVHEMVHARINRMKLTLDDRDSLMKGVQKRAFEKLGLKATKKNISKYVTDYAVTDAEECIADAIAIISRRGERANDVCKSLFEELKKVIE